MTTNRELFEQALKVMPGGVNSPVRAFRAVKSVPPFIAEASDSRLLDVEGKEYLDFVGSWGPLLLGHSEPRVAKAVRRAAGLGLTYGACHEGEAQLAEEIRDAMPHVEKVRLVSSGTEAAMSALRLARAATGRERFVKFKGCYHGHADPFLVAAGSGGLTFGAPSSPGVTAGAAADTLLADYNRLDTVERLFMEFPDGIACVFVEPVAGNMGVVPPAPGFLAGLARLCRAHGALLVFDEVITGFRVGRGGAAELYGVTPDLTVLGKIVGGGMPLAAFGGPSALMDLLSPVGKVYQAGTLSGNPLSVAAGLTTLRIIRREHPYPGLEALAAWLDNGIRSIMAGHSGPWTLNRVGSMMTLFFGIARAETLADIEKADTETYANFHARLLHDGIYMPPSQFEAFFVSTAHGAADMDRFLCALQAACSDGFRPPADDA